MNKRERNDDDRPNEQWMDAGLEEMGEWTSTVQGEIINRQWEEKRSTNRRGVNRCSTRLLDFDQWKIRSDVANRN